MARSTTHARDTVADVIETVRHAVRAAIGADDVVVDEVAPDAHEDAGATFSTDVALRGGRSVRVHVTRAVPLEAAEQDLVRGLAHLLGHQVAAAGEAELVSRLADLVDAALLELDTMIGATVEERLVKVARGVAEVLDAAAWSVRILVDDAWTLVAEDQRRRRSPDPAAAWAPFDTRELALDEGSTVVRPDDGTRAGEALRGRGLTSLLGATGYDPDAVSWTVCLLGDERSGDLAPGRTALAALVPAALGFPLPPRSGGLLRSVG